MNELNYGLETYCGVDYFQERVNFGAIDATEMVIVMIRV